MADIVHGGWRGVKDATRNTQSICDRVKSHVEKFTGKTYEVFRAVKYREPGPPNERNYLIQVYVGVEDYIHLNVKFEIGPIVHNAPIPIEWLRGVEQGRTKDSPLLPFMIHVE